MFNISAWTIKKPIPSIVLFLVLTISGLWSFTQLEMDELPNVDIPSVTVTIAQNGASPSELEVQITRKVEDALSGLSNLKHIASTITEGVSSTNIQFALGTNTDRAVNDVRDRINRIRITLPIGISEPIIQRVDRAGNAFATYTVSSDQLNDVELSWLIDNEIARALLSLPGVGQVERAGGVNREIRINLDPAKLESVGLTADSVNDQVRYRNVNLPGGRGSLSGSEQTIRTIGSSLTLASLKNLKIALVDGAFVRLDSLGSVEDSYAEPRQLALLDGKPVVAFSIRRATGHGMAQVSKLIDEKLEAMKGDLPQSVKIEKVRSSVKFVKESFYATLESLILGAVLAVVTIWLFLRDIRSAAISAVAMPLSMIPTFLFIKLLGFTLNNMSMLGLALVIGILVDDAIVEVENIVRHIHQGKSPYQAALDASDEIGLAVIATTFSIIAVFVPVAWLGGIAGQFFREFGYTVAIAVFMSLAVARLITPMMAANWLKSPPTESNKSIAVVAYERALQWALQNRKTTIVASCLFFAASLALNTFIPMNLMGATDRGETALDLELAPGTDILSTTETVRLITQFLLRNKNIDNVFATIGTPTDSGAGSGSDASTAVNQSTLYIKLVKRSQRKFSQEQVEEQIRTAVQEFPGVRSHFQTVAGPGGKLEYSLVSSCPNDLDAFAEKLTQQMRHVKGLADVRSSASLRSPQLVVRPNRELAAESGITVQAVARTALVATIGDNDIGLGKFDLPDRQLNIRVQLDPQYRRNLKFLKNLKLSNNRGELIPLASIATLDIQSGLFQISRYDKQRKITISAQLVNHLTLGEALKVVRNLPAQKERPAIVHECATGDIEIQQEVFAGFGIAMLSAVLMMYVVLVLLFDDFIHPLTIMVSLPLSIGGAFAAILVTGQALGLYAIIGIVMLMGLVAKNAILLIEYCLMSIDQGMSMQQAIMTAGEARMRPILMTTLAMIAGMTPIALGWGAGSEARAPMAIAVIGGLAVSMVLTLIVVPVIFATVYDKRHKKSKKSQPNAMPQFRSRFDIQDSQV